VTSAKRIAAAAILGGSTSALTGGKFANGAITGAFSRAFNDEIHDRRESFIKSIAYSLKEMDGFEFTEDDAKFAFESTFRGGLKGKFANDLRRAGKLTQDQIDFGLELAIVLNIEGDLIIDIGKMGLSGLSGIPLKTLRKAIDIAKSEIDFDDLMENIQERDYGEKSGVAVLIAVGYATRGDMKIGLATQFNWIFSWGALVMINSKFILLVFFTFNSSLHAYENNCLNWINESLKLKKVVEESSSNKVDLNKIYLKIEPKDTNSVKPSLLLVNKYELPIFNVSNNLDRIKFNTKIDDTIYKYESNNLLVIATIYNLEDLNEFKEGDEKFIPKDLNKIDGYAEVVKNTSHYELYNLMFNTNFKNIDCNKSINYPLMVYTIYSKLTTSFYGFDWYHISKPDYNLILNVNYEDNTIDMNFYTDSELIELRISYKKSIEIEKFKSWLNHLNISKQ
jgi:hypothetical protein